MNATLKDILELILLAVAFVAWLIRLENKVKDSAELAKKIDALRDEFSAELTNLERTINSKFDEARRETRTAISEARDGFTGRLTDLKELLFNHGNRAAHHE